MLYCDVHMCMLFFPLLLCWVGIHCSIYKGSYNVSNTSYLNSPPPLVSFIPTLPIHGTVSTAIIFAFTYMCIQYL
jgi:hypothetical protein